MSYEEDPPYTSSARSKIILSQSIGLASSSVLGKRRERSENDISFPKANSRQGSMKPVQKEGKYHGVDHLSNSKFRSRISRKRNQINLGEFQLESDAAMVYDEALALLATFSKSQQPNFNNEEDYEDARKKELRLKYENSNSAENFERFAEQFPKPYNEIKEAALCKKLGRNRLAQIKWRKRPFLDNSGKVDTKCSNLCYSCGKEEVGGKHPCLQ